MQNIFVFNCIGLHGTKCIMKKRRKNIADKSKARVNGRVNRRINDMYQW